MPDITQDMANFIAVMAGALFVSFVAMLLASGVARLVKGMLP